MENQPLPNPGDDLPVTGALPGQPARPGDIHEERTELLGGTAPRDTATPSPPRRESGSGGSGAVPDLEGRSLGGYRFKRKLGAGGMGAVYLAEQLSLDRDVAVKVLPGRFASDPAFIARFTREALSAAQLNHHNIMQVFDIDAVGDIHFIVMEYVRGRDLGDMVRKDGKLQPEDAAGYVLQASRGLAYAHRHGIVHRDIKPDNMMLNEHGVIKIADMGLAKMKKHKEAVTGLAREGTEEALRQQAYSDLTGAEMAMGTPAYMSPEQGRDASSVDHRADQYSLGCTLYYLIAGKAPYSGRTSFEIISKHQSEPLIPIEAIVRNVPEELSIIIQKMLAKNPDDRYTSLDGVTEALEGYLGVSSEAGTYTPREHHVDILEKELKAFQAVPARRLARLAPVIFFGIMAILAIALPLAMGGLGIPGGAFVFSACLGMMAMTPAFHFLLNGFMTREYFYRKAKGIVFGTSVKGWALIGASALLALIVLYLTGLLVPWLIVSFLAAGVAAAWQFLYLRPLRTILEKHVNAVRQMLRELRLRGVAEESIQDFVCRFSGERWEEFFECLFGYEDMVLQRARSVHLDKVRPRRRFAAWRDPIARWMDELEEARRREREKRQLARAEKGRLRSEGVSEKEAEEKARDIASQAVDEGLLKETAILPSRPSRAELRKEAKKKEEAAMELHKSARSRLPSVGFVYRLVRLVGGLVILLAFSTVYIGHLVPGALAPFLSLYFSQGAVGTGGGSGYYLGQSYFALIVGAALVISGFSRRMILPTLILAGAAMVVLVVPVTAQSPSPHFTPVTAPWAGTALSILALFALLLTRGRQRQF